MINNKTNICINFNSIVILLFCLLFVRGIVFVFFIPLWQGPDEPTHTECIMRLSQQRSFNMRLEPDKRIDQKIIISMARNNYEGFEGDIKGHVSPYANPNYPPFYYFINSALINLLQIKSFEGQIYFIRCLSMILGIINIFLIYLIANIMVSGTDKLFSVAVASFAGFLPQYSFMTSTVNPENLSNLIITAVIFISLLVFNHGLKWHYVLSMILLLFLGCLTKNTIYIVFPSVFAIFSVQLWYKLLDYKMRLRKHTKIIIVAFLTLVIVGSMALLLYNHALYKIFEKGSGVLVSCRNVFSSGVNYPDLYLKELAVIFVSFWLTLGLMVYKMSIGWYVFLFILTCASFSGFVKFVIQLINKKENENINIKVVAMLAFILVVNFAAIFFDEFKNKSVDLNQVLFAQGRYLFPSLSAIACLFVLGIRSISPIAFKTESIKLLTLFMIFLNMVSIFKYLIPIYYL